jgi:hypothetical protein
LPRAAPGTRPQRDADDRDLHPRAAAPAPFAARQRARRQAPSSSYDRDAVGLQVPPARQRIAHDSHAS